MKIAVVTGAFGFAGANLTEQLLKSGYKVYAVGREKSEHNKRLKENNFLRCCFVNMEEYDRLSEYISERDIPENDFFFFHLAWGGERNDFDAQYANVTGALLFMDAAIKLKKRANSVRFIGIGSQAEYGIKSDAQKITEDMSLEPFSAYGACKAAAYYLLKKKAESFEIPFVWGRIFSLIGRYEPNGRMFSDMIHGLRQGKDVFLSSCEQYWDYLDASDAARAIIALGERGRDKEAYNIASGNYRRLKEYVFEAADATGADRGLVHFGDRAEPFVSFKPSVAKIKADTMWEAQIPLTESIKYY